MLDIRNSTSPWDNGNLSEPHCHDAAFQTIPRHGIIVFLGRCSSYRHPSVSSALFNLCCWRRRLRSDRQDACTTASRAPRWHMGCCSACWPVHRLYRPLHDPLLPTTVSMSLRPRRERSQSHISTIASYMPTKSTLCGGMTRTSQRNGALPVSLFRQLAQIPDES